MAATPELHRQFRLLTLSWRILLATSVGFGSCFVTTSTLAAASGDNDIPTSGEPISQPNIQRRQVKTAQIDTEDTELGFFAGLYSVEDFGASWVYGITWGYHVTEDFFFEAEAGLTRVDDSAFRNIGLPIFPEEHENLTFYDLDLGYKLFPGEYFLGKDRAFTSHLYIIGGLGNTHFAGSDLFTYNVGIGVRLLFTDWVSLRIDFRDHVFETDLLGTNKTTHNTDTRLGLTILF